MTIPCGKFERGGGISFTYYVKSSLQVLASATADYPQFDVTRSDDGVTVCCVANISLPNDFIHGSTCYQLNVSCKAYYCVPSLLLYHTLITELFATCDRCPCTHMLFVILCEENPALLRTASIL